MSSALPKLIITIDQSVLSQASGDCLVLLREVNKQFTTAFAVAQLTATQPHDRQLLSRNVFTWVDEFQIIAWRPYEEGLLAAQASAVCNPVEITFKETTRFVNSILQPAKSLGTQGWSNPPERTFAIENLGFQFRFRVLQRARPGGSFLPLFTSEFTPSLQGRTEICVGEKFALFWSNVQVAAGDSVKIPDDKSKLQIVTLSEGVPQHLRYGYIIVDKPGVTEDPGWYPEPLPSSLLPINSSRTTSSKL